MPDIPITITIPSDKVAIATPLFLAEKKMPQIPDPDWVDPEDGTPHPSVDEFTLKQWAKIVLLKQFKKICRRGKTKLDLAAASAAWDEDIAV